MNSLFLGVANFPCCDKTHLILAAWCDRTEVGRTFLDALCAAEPGHGGTATASMLVEVNPLQLPALHELVTDAITQTAMALLLLLEPTPETRQ